MNTFLELGFDPELCNRICLTLAHSLWQVSLLAACAVLLVSRLRRDKPERGYAVYVGAMLLAIAALPITYWQLGSDMLVVNETLAATNETGWSAQSLEVLPPREIVKPRADSEPVSSAAAIVSNQAATSVGFAAIAPWLLGVYLLGVVVMLLRVWQGVWKAHRLASIAQPISSGPLFAALERLARSWSLRVVPKLAQAQNILVPQVVGLLRPTILIPTSALAGLTPSELEMILAHELAHVHRHDMWVNLLQRLAEAVLFFNPALWYLSRQSSIYREYCCDEQTCRGADQSSPNRVQYAQALLRIVELSGQTDQRPELAALASSGGRPSELRRRVARLFGEPLREPIRVSRSGLLAIVIGLGLMAVAPLSWQNAAEPVKDEKQSVAAGEHAAKPKVEVLAIGTHDEEPQRWWNSEGEVLEDVPFKIRDASVTGESRQLVFRIPELPKDADVTWSLSGCGGNANGEVVLNGEEAPFGYFSNLFAIRKGSPMVKLRVGVATGEWRVAATADGSSSQSMALSNGKSIAFAGVFTEKDQYSKDKQATVAVVSHNIHGLNVRLIAVDKSGKSHRSSRSRTQYIGNDSLLQTKYSYRNVLPTDIQRFEFQTRDYEWTEIDDLPVEPGLKTTSAPSEETETLAILTLTPQQTEWIAKLRKLTDHNPTAFSVGPQMIAELSPPEAWEVVQTVWPEIEVDEVKTGLLKTFEFARHPKVLNVLDLGATDESDFVRDYAYSYLQNYALRDFKKPEHDYQLWRSENAQKTIDEVLAANCQWFVEQLRSQPPITDPMVWQEIEMMLELSGSKSSYPAKADYLIKAGLPAVLRSWRDDTKLDDQMKRQITAFLGNLEKTLDDSLPYINVDLSGRNLEGLSLVGNVESLFRDANLSKTNLSNATLVGGAKAFYETNFSEANLKDAVLIGRASLQRANFSGANLENTLLKSGASGLQEANFDDAVIQGARLHGSLQLATFRRTRIADTRFEGIGPAMQMSNFDDAQLTNTTLVGTSFQAVSLNNTEFKECDLSSVRANDLASSKFESATPPRYDAATKFPEDFDPADHGWQLIE